jgi:ketosteroid isomerase-like protein
VALGACGIALAQNKPATSMWNDEAAKAARTVAEQGLAAMERFDAAGLEALCTADVVAFDIDLDNKPVRVGSQNEAFEYLAGISAGAKEMGATFKFENVKCDCRATSDLAYCILEYDFVATTADSTRMVQPSHTTVVLTKADGAWKWAHWHTSLSEAP